MRVIIDTNVLMSAIFFGGIPGRLLSSWTSGRFTLVLSPEILDEYRRVGLELVKRHPSVGESLEPILTLISMNAVFIGAPPLDEPVCEDVDDDKFLACALASGTEVIISGDKHLLQVAGWRSLKIMTPRQFHEKHLKGKEP